MATSIVPSNQYMTGNFVVSAGSVLFRRSTSGTLEICVLYQRKKEEWLLPQGRKDCGESIEAAAVRETFEETGVACGDTVQVVDGATEPIAVTVRDLGAKGLKIIWWYVSRVTSDGKKVEGTQMDNEDFDSRFVEAEEAVGRLSFQGDRDIAAQVLALVKESTLYLVLAWSYGHNSQIILSSKEEGLSVIN